MEASSQFPPKGTLSATDDSHDPFLDRMDGGRSQMLLDYIRQRPDIQTITGNPVAVLQAMTDFKSEYRMMTFQQEKLDASKRIIEEHARARNQPLPKVIVELGTYVGHSAIGWGWMVRQWYPNWKQDDGCKVIAMEASPTIARVATQLIAIAGLSETVEVVVGKSADSLRSLSGKGYPKIDMLFFDHWEQFYVPDLKLCEELKLLRTGTILVADNTDKPGAPDYLAYLRNGGGDGWKYGTDTHDTPHEPGAPSLLEVSIVIEAP